MPPAARRPLLLLAAVVWLTLASGATARTATVRDYDLGRVEIPDPGPKGPLPVRLWGAIGVPGGPGPHPLVVIVHGRHGDNCPRAPGEEFTFTWPCFAREQRNDLGLRHVVAALAGRGIVAISPDVNGAYTIGWGEDRDELRWPRIVSRTLSELAKEVDLGGGRFGVDLEDRVDLSSLGLLGHSRSGHNAVRLAHARARGAESPAQIAAGRGGFDSLFLLAPVHEGVPLPDAESAIVAAGCDGDVPGQARRYLDGARRQRNRTEPAFQIKLVGANHNYFNSTLVTLGRDDGRFSPLRNCGRAQRLGAGEQRSWLDRTAAAFFDATLDGARRPSWMRPVRTAPDEINGLPVVLTQLFP